MTHTQTRTIDGFEIIITQLPAMKSLRMLTRLGKLFGPALTKALTGLDLKGGIKTVSSADLTTLGAGITELFMSVTEDEIESLAKALLGSATLNNAPFMQTADVQLQGQALTYLKILLFALEVNYGSFFDALRGLGAAEMVKARKA